MRFARWPAPSPRKNPARTPFATTAWRRAARSAPSSCSAESAPEFAQASSAAPGSTSTREGAATDAKSTDSLISPGCTRAFARLAGSGGAA